MILELKSVEKVKKYLLNFGEALMKDDITRTVNGLVDRRVLGDLGVLARVKSDYHYWCYEHGMNRF